MTEQTDAAEVGADRLDYDLFYESGLGLDGPTVERIVAWLLASDWLAAREAAARAEALREAADALNTTDHATETALGGVDYVTAWLRDRADSIARTDGAGS